MKSQNFTNIEKIKEKYLNRYKDFNSLIPMNILTYKGCILLVDIETIGDLNKMQSIFPYDISYKVISINNGVLEVVEQGTLLIKDIFENKYHMKNAFFKNKIPYYLSKFNEYNLSKDKKYFEKVLDKEGAKRINALIKKYNIKIVSAYNVSFDYMGINNLFNENKTIKNNFKKLYKIDIMVLAFIYFLNFPKELLKFKRWCIKHNKRTENNNCSFTAETLYCFFFKTLKFKENHTGLEDTKIELKIVQYIINKFIQENIKLEYKLGITKNNISQWLYRGSDALLSLK